MHLVRLIGERKVIRGKFSSAVTSERKRQAWQEVTDELNAVRDGGRTRAQCEKRWYFVASQAKAAAAEERRVLDGTGEQFLVRSCVGWDRARS